MSNELEKASGASAAFEEPTRSAAAEDTAEPSWNTEELDRLLAEANALALYIARHGDSLGEDKDGLYAKLLQAISEAYVDPFVGSVERPDEVVRGCDGNHVQGMGRERQHDPGYAGEEARFDGSLVGPTVVRSKDPADGDRRLPLRPRTHP